MSGLPPQLAEHLVEADDSTLAHYAREIGLETVNDSRRHFDNLIQGLSEEEYVPLADTFGFFLRRICSVMAEEFDYQFYLNDLDFLESFPPLTRHRIMVTRNKIWEMENMPELPHEVRIDSVQAYYDMMAECGDRFGMAAAKMVLWGLHNPVEHKEKRRRYILEASRDFEEMGMHLLTCQSLGVLGIIYEREGKIDSMETCFQKARNLALQHGLSAQISRFSYFYGHLYARMGRLALANDLFNEAIELCKTYKGGYYEIRFLFHAMEFYAEHSCWETVRRLLSRAKILLKVYEGTRFSDQFLAGTKYIEARWLMENGEADRADALYRSVYDTYGTAPPLISRHSFLYHWARGLLEHGRADDAIEIIEEGLTRLKREVLVREEVKFLLLEAVAEFERGNIDSAREAIEKFEIRSPRYTDPFLQERITLCVIRARIAMSEGNRSAAFALVEEGLRRLESFLGYMDISIQGYLYINERVELRKLLQELTAHDPKLAYGAELYWHSLPLGLGERESDPATSYSLLTALTAGSKRMEDSYPIGGLEDHLRELADRVIAYSLELDAAHCLYAMHGNDVIRYTVSDGDIRREEIECTREELRGLVIETQAHMSGEGRRSGPVDSRTIHDNLSKLGGLLLPDELCRHEATDVRSTLMITTDSFLGHIPFETFDVGSGEAYVPLLERFDVVYLKHMGTEGAPRGSGNPGMIVVNSGSGDMFRSRRSFGRQLKCVAEEGQAIAAMHDDAILLQGSEATKREIKKQWERASFLYFATHIIRDPEIPFLVLIPLPVPEGDTSPESGLLDFTDIRAADFRACDVVVLSGCSSGAPSVSAGVSGPSLGDAFLDAGAAVVIATFWDVKDEEARKLMTLYAGEMGTTDRAHIRSLCNARRKLLGEEPESGISFDWASYAIHVGRLPN